MLGLMVSFLLTLDVPPPPAEDAVPLVLHYGDDGEVDVRLGLWDEDAGTVTVAVDEFSFWGSAWNVATAPGRWVWQATESRGGGGQKGGQIRCGYDGEGG